MGWTENEERYRAMFDDALRLRDEGNNAEAIRMLEAVIEGLTAADRRLLSAAHGICGQLMGRVGDVLAAERHFRRAVDAMPRWDLASLGLFHVLLRQKLVDEALAEAERYSELKVCDDYRMLMRAADFLEGLTAEQRVTAARIFALIARHATKC
jgi:tetratricopeptide (TPR) repeat protein